MKYVISLGGSLIIPNEINRKFLIDFTTFVKSLIRRGHSFVIVCGGGSIARKYIESIRSLKLKADFESLVGIETTKLNAALVSSFFGKFHLVPNSLADINKAKIKLNYEPKYNVKDGLSLAADWYSNFFNKK